MNIFILFALHIFTLINSLTINFTPLTIIERGCNWGKNDFSYFDVGEYSDNGFFIINELPYDINNINNINTQKTTSTGKINVYVYESKEGNKIKKTMDCKYTTAIGFEILFCDFLNGNKVYYGIQLSNDGEIGFSGDYSQNILTCKSAEIIPIPETEEIKNEKTEEIKNEKSEEIKNEKTNEKSEYIINENKNEKLDEKTPTDKKEDIVDKKEENIDDENKEVDDNDHNNNNNNDNNNDKQEEKNKSENKNNNFLGISKNAAIGASVGCFGAAAGFVGALIYTIKKSSSRASSLARSSGTSNDRNNLNDNNQSSTTSVNTPSKKVIFTIITGGVVIFSIAGMTFLVPVLPSVRIDYVSEDSNFNEAKKNTWIYDEDAYRQHSLQAGVHKHWMGDCKGRKEYGYSNETYIDKNGKEKKKACWFCKSGCAVSSYLHMKDLQPTKENICKYLNKNADMDWTLTDLKISKIPHDDCIGKMEKEKIVDGKLVKYYHFVHIKKIIDDNNYLVFDPDGGDKTMKKKDFIDFRVRK